MNGTGKWQMQNAVETAASALHRAPAAAMLVQIAFALAFAVEALLYLLSINDIRTSFALLRSAARILPGRIGSHR